MYPVASPIRERQACRMSSEDLYTWRGIHLFPRPPPRRRVRPGGDNPRTDPLVASSKAPSSPAMTVHQGKQSTVCPSCPLDQRPSAALSRLPVLVHLGVPPLLDLRLLGGLLHLGPYLGLETLARAQDLALEIEGAALLRVVGVEQPLEPTHDVLEIGRRALRRLDVEDLAGLVERHAGADVDAAGGADAAVLRLRSLVLARCRRLLVGLGEGAPENAAAD